MLVVVVVPMLRSHDDICLRLGLSAIGHILLLLLLWVLLVLLGIGLLLRVRLGHWSIVLLHRLLIVVHILGSDSLVLALILALVLILVLVLVLVLD